MVVRKSYTTNNNTLTNSPTYQLTKNELLQGIRYDDVERSERRNSRDAV